MARNRRKRVRLARGIWVGRLVEISILVVCLALGYVWLRVQMVDIGYQIRAKERRLAGVKKENQVLRMKIAQMKSPKNIEAMIRAKDMDLMATKNWQLVVLPKEAGCGTFKTGTPQTQGPKLVASFRQAQPSARVPMQ